MGFLIFCGVTLGVTLLCLNLFPKLKEYNDFNDAHKHNSIKLKFEQFRKFYLINPSAWDIDKYSCARYDKNCYYIKFSLIDYFKYRKFLKTKDHVKDKLMENFLELIQEDIDKKREEAMRELEQAQEEQFKVLKEKLKSKEESHESKGQVLAI